VNLGIYKPEVHQQGSVCCILKTAHEKKKSKEALIIRLSPQSKAFWREGTSQETRPDFVALVKYQNNRRL